eukprot:TRINITY_DN6014_c0_g1_i1.p1 TRINITY_DN6014_c0_g1~~TRINITY_DN6014_c0_g1_i1.p1  ORF type:complete len:220 (+),score=24.34 TRINITY_DN6014_c0_g1_i1:51-662(+)
MHRTPKQIVLTPQEHPVVIDLNSLTSPGMQPKVVKLDLSGSGCFDEGSPAKRKGVGVREWKRTTPAIIGGFLGGLLMIMIVLLMTKPPRHDLAARNRSLDKENEVLKNLARKKESSFLARLDELEAKVSHSVSLRPGALVTAAHDFHVGEKTIVTLGSPGIVISREHSTNHTKAAKWVVQFTGTWGPNKPVRLLASDRDIIAV